MARGGRRLSCVRATRTRRRSTRSWSGSPPRPAPAPAEPAGRRPIPSPWSWRRPRKSVNDIVKPELTSLMNNPALRQRHELHVQHDRLDHAVGLEREPALVAPASPCRGRPSCTSCPCSHRDLERRGCCRSAACSRSLSSLLSAELFIRLFSSARTRSLTLLRVAASSVATGSVVVAVRRGGGRREPDELRIQRVRVQVGRAHLAGARALERDPLGDVALRGRVERDRIDAAGFTALPITMSADGPPA